MKSIQRALLIGLAIAITGCYGPFRLTKKLHSWNGTVGEKWVNELVFLGLNVLPVYPFAALGDAIIFNSIEFWGGNNPVAKRTMESGEKQVVLTSLDSGDSLRVDGFDRGRPAGSLVFSREKDGRLSAKTPDGKIVMSARQVGDEVILADASGRERARHPVSDVEKFLNR